MDDDDGRSPERDQAEDTGHDADTRRTAALSIDATLELLAHHDRRRILDYLVTASEHVATTEELVEHLLQSKAAQTGEVPSRNHLEAALHHLHLPKLVDTGVIEYDPRSQQLRYLGDDRLEAWLKRIKREEQDS